MAAHKGAPLLVKLALLRRGVGLWRGRAVDEGDNIIALCILACVKDGLVFKLQVCLMCCFSVKASGALLSIQQPCTEKVLSRCSP